MNPTVDSKESQESIPTESLASSILSRIEKENIEPLSKALLLMRNIALWTIISIVLLMIALIFSPFAYRSLFLLQPDGYMSLRELFSVYFIGLMMVGISLLMLAFIRLIRTTASGHRISYIKIIGSGVIIFIIGSITFCIIGAGKLMDDKVYSLIPQHRSLESVRNEMMYHPHEGMLIGKPLHVTEKGFVLSAPDKRLWVVEVDKFFSTSSIIIIKNADSIGVKGKITATSTDGGEIIACDIINTKIWKGSFDQMPFPWKSSHLIYSNNDAVRNCDQKL